MTDNILNDIERLEAQARYGVDGLAGYARTQRQEAHNYRAQRDAALTRLHEVREVRKQLGGLLEKWDKAIDPDNLPQREDRDWREVVSRSAELLQAILVDLDRWLYEPLEEEEKV